MHWVQRLIWEYSCLYPLLVLFVFSCSVVSDFVIPWAAACQTFLSFTFSRSLLKLIIRLELMMPSNHLILIETWCWGRLRAGGEGGDRSWNCLYIKLLIHFAINGVSYWPWNKFMMTRARLIKTMCFCAGQVSSPFCVLLSVFFLSSEIHLKTWFSETWRQGYAQWIRTCLPEQIRKSQPCVFYFFFF